MRTRSIAVVLALAAAGLLTVGPATAAAPYASKITIARKGPKWHGDVKSAGNLLHGVRSCERKRLVKMYKRQDGPDRLIGTDLTNRAGRWLIPDEPAKGIYYAKVAGRRAGDKPACAPDKSGVEFIR